MTCAPAIERTVAVGLTRVVLVALMLCLDAVASPAIAEVRLRRGGYVMGTLLEVTVYVPDREQGSRLLDDLFAVAHRLDAALTTFDTNSPVWRLAERAGQGPQRTDPDLADALALSVDYWRSTRGTFDVTVKPLSDLWHAAGRDEKPPSPGALARTLSIIGSDKVLVHSDGSVELKRSGMALDFGGIGKGYALDKMVEVLRAHKVRRAFLSFGLRG